MRTLRAWITRIAGMVMGRRRDREVHEELRAHVDFHAEEIMRAGMPRDQARRQALLKLGGVDQVREQHHDRRGLPWLERSAKEIAFAWRRLVRSPAFTVASVLTLALAVGANAAIFAIVQRVVLAPLPYPASDQLLQIEHAIPRIHVPSGIGMTVGLYRQYLDGAQTLESVAIYRVSEATLVRDGEPDRIQVARTTPTLASVLRVAPAQGRWLRDTEGTPGAPHVAVLSHGLWMRRFGGDSGVLGSVVTLDGESATIIGVMPASFAFPDRRVEMWLPEQISPASGFGLPFSYAGVARLRPDVAVGDTRAELNRLIADLPRAYPGDFGVLGNVGEGGLTSVAIPLKGATIGDIGRALWFLLGAVGVVLLIACANVANLFMVRAEARHREVSVRRALGASRLGLAGFFLAESMLLSLMGGVAGLFIASGAVHLLVTQGPSNLPRLQEVRLDAVAITFMIGVSVLAAFTLGSIPLWRRSLTGASLLESGRSNTASVGSLRLRHLLMSAQIALALVLLVASGLILRSFQQLRAFDPGFDPSSTLTFRVGLPEREYPTREKAVAAHQAILDQLTRIPGITGASASTGVPLATACFTNTVIVQGRPTTNTTRASAALCAVAGGYTETMRLRVLRGRGIDRDDVERRRANVVVNKALVDTVFPNEDAIGRRIRSNAPPKSAPHPDDAGGWTWDGAPPWLTIVGIVADTPFAALGEEHPVPMLYMPMSLAGGPDIPRLEMLGPDVSIMNYVIRATVPPLGLLPIVRRAIDAVNPALAVAQASTLQDILDRGSAQMAFTMVLLAVAAAVALVLGLVGVYGVTSYIVSQRTGEIGVRLALGAEPRGIAGMIVRQGSRVAVAGATVGLIAAFAGSRLIESLLYGVSPRDPSVFAAATMAMLAVAIAACWLPARIAARISPLNALRVD